MTSLRQIQRRFAADLLADKALRHDGLLGLERIPVKRLFNVYRNNSKASLRAALAALYPVTQKLVGREFFQYLADCYLQDYPLHSGGLQRLGHRMPDFLSSFEPASTLPYLADVAKVEWSYYIVSLAARLEAAVNVLSVAHSKTPLHKLRFKLAPASRLVSSSYPIFSIWASNQDGFSGDQSISLEEGPQVVLVLRSSQRVELWRLRGPEATFVRALAAGCTLGATVEALLNTGHEFNLETLLLEYVHSGYLVTVSSDLLSVNGT